MEIKKLISKLHGRNLFLALGAVAVAAVVAGAVFLPGTLFRGLVPQFDSQVYQQLNIPLSVSCEADPSPAYTGQTVTFTSKPVGGEKPYTYQWAVPNSSPVVSYPGPNTATLDVKFANVGPNVVRTYIIDADGTSVFSQCSVQVNDPPPFTLACQVDPAPAIVGQPTTFTGVATGGVGEVKYAWIDKNYITDPDSVDPNIHAIVSQTVTTTFDEPGFPSNIMAGAVDSLNRTATKVCQFAVGYAPLEASCSVSPDPAAVNGEVTWTAAATGGTGVYEYTWYDSEDPVVDGATTQSVKTKYTAIDSNKTVNLIVTDSNGATDGATCGPLNVEEAPPQVNPLIVSCNTVPNTIESGDTVTWTALAAGGDGTFTYSWEGDKIDGKTTNSVQAVFTQKPLTNAFKVTVKSDGQTKTVTCPQLTFVPEEEEPEEEDVEEEETEVTVTTGEPSKCPGVDYPSDISGHWAEEFIKKGYDYCLFKGVDGKFFPDRNATRIEAASMILYAKGFNPAADCTNASCGMQFNDLENSEQGAVLSPLYFAGLIEGYPNNLFKPQALITRAEGASLIVRAFFEPFGRECQDPHCGAGWPDNFFLDITETWQGKYIRVLWDYRIMTGSGPNRVEPNRNITRAEMAKMIVLAYEEANR